MKPGYPVLRKSEGKEQATVSLGMSACSERVNVNGCRAESRTLNKAHAQNLMVAINNITIKEKEKEEEGERTYNSSMGL